MKRNRFHVLWTVLVLGSMVALAPSARAASNRLGVGANYWRTVDDLDKRFDRDGISWLVTYQRTLSRLLALQSDVEWFQSGFAGATHDVFAPQAFLLAGGSIYAGVGIGILYSDGRFNDKPYYAVRAGLDMEILPTIHLDINANYQFSEWHEINRLQNRLGSDTVFMGAAVRFEF